MAGGGGGGGGGGLFAGGGGLLAGAAVVATETDEVVGTGFDVVAEVRTGAGDDVRVGPVADDGADPDGWLISVDWLLKVAAIPPTPPIRQTGRTQTPMATPPRINRTRWVDDNLDHQVETAFVGRGGWPDGYRGGTPRRTIPVPSDDSLSFLVDCDQLSTSTGATSQCRARDFVIDHETIADILLGRAVKTEFLAIRVSQPNDLSRPCGCRCASEIKPALADIGIGVTQRH